MYITIINILMFIISIAIVSIIIITIKITITVITISIAKWYCLSDVYMLNQTFISCSSCVIWLLTSNFVHVFLFTLFVQKLQHSMN